MNADEKRKVFEELLDRYQDFIESEFSYEDGEREAERKAWLNKYDGIKEPLIKDEKIRKVVRAWAEVNGYKQVEVTFGAVNELDGYNMIRFETIDIVDPKKLGIYTIRELCGEEEE